MIFVKAFHFIVAHAPVIVRPDVMLTQGVGTMVSIAASASCATNSERRCSSQTAIRS